MFGRRNILATLISVLAVVAIAVSAYLTWVIWQSGSVAGCTGESLLDCNDVLTSRWSKWFGLPVSLLGGLTYLAILGLCWPAAKHPQGLAMPGLFALATLAAGAAFWFVGVQAIQLQSFCLYCLTVHSCGLVVGVLALLLFIDSSGHDDDFERGRALLGVASDDFVEESSETAGGARGVRLLASLSFSAVGLAALMGGQLLSDASDTMKMEEVDFQTLTIEPPDGLAVEEDRLANADEETTGVELSKGSKGVESSPNFDDASTESSEETKSQERSGPRWTKFEAIPYKVDINLLPMVGNIDAPHVLFEMMDYTCVHCRHLHKNIRAALDRYGDEIGIAIHHVPLSKKCNKYITKSLPEKKYACDYARLAIGVWKLAPEKFPGFHDWLLELEKPPGIAKARSRALSLVGDAILLDKRAEAEISKRLASQIDFFRKFKSGLPLLLMEKGAIRGIPEDSQQLFDYMEERFGIVPQTTAE